MAGNEAVTEATSKSFVPDLFKAELKAGDWMYASKLSIATFLRPGNPLDVRIQSCLMVHSWGYSSELAVIQKAKKFKDDPKLIVPLSPFGIAQILANSAIQHYEESAPKGTPKPDTKIVRTYMRETLAKMEDDGIIDRCRANCETVKLVGLSYHEALRKGLVTPVRELSPDAKKKLTRQMVVYLLAKPRPAKMYNEGLVALKRYLGSQPVEITEQKRAIQLAFQFLPDLKTDPERAAELVGRPDVRQEIALYHQTIEVAKEQAEERLARFFQTVAKPAGPKPAPNENQVSLFPVAADELVSKPRKRSAAPPEADVALVLEEMRKAGAADRDAAVQLIAACRAHSAQASATLIAESVKSKVLLARRRDNPAGFLIVAVPKLFEGHTQQAPAAAGPRCEACGEPLTDRGSRDGVCFACLDKQEARATA